MSLLEDLESFIAPEGRQNLAQGFNPGFQPGFQPWEPPPRRRALKGRQIRHIGNSPEEHF
jgi:hypothetical protein